MPFDPAPIQPAVEVGPFQADADLMLRGCAMTEPHRKDYGYGRLACALGAWRVAQGFAPTQFDCETLARQHKMEDAYEDHYGVCIHDDNDFGRFTREQIAARIAALR